LHLVAFGSLQRIPTIPTAPTTNGWPEIGEAGTRTHITFCRMHDGTSSTMALTHCGGVTGACMQDHAHTGAFERAAHSTHSGRNRAWAKKKKKYSTVASLFG